MSGSTSRRKGHTFERKVATILRERFPNLTFARTIQSRFGGKEGGDVVGLPGFHLELQHAANPTPNEKLKQAIDDARVCAPGAIPVAITHKTKAKSTEVTLRLEDLVKLWTAVDAIGFGHVPVTIDFEDFLDMAQAKVAADRLAELWHNLPE